MQRLDAPAEHLRRTGDLVDRDPRDAGGLDLRAGAARRDDLDVERMQRAGELLEARGVGHADQRAVDAAHAALLAPHREHALHRAPWLEACHARDPNDPGPGR